MVSILPSYVPLFAVSRYKIIADEFAGLPKESVLFSRGLCFKPRGEARKTHFQRSISSCYPSLSLVLHQISEVLSIA